MHHRIAWLAAATHVIASLAMLVLLRGGLPGAPDDARAAYIAAHRLAWMSGWMLWQLAAVSLIAFYAVLALRFRGVLSIMAMCVAAAGLSIDFACESRYMAGSLDPELDVMIGYAANGLYTIAFALLVAAGWRVLPKPALALAGPVIVSGAALAVAALLRDARLEVITSAVLFPCFTLWIVMIALWLRRSA